MKRSEMGPFMTKLSEAFEHELAGLPLTKKSRGDMLAGFKDGVRSAMFKLKEIGELQVDESA